MAGIQQDCGIKHSWTVSLQNKIMNYIQILQDSFRLFRTNKLIWVFGFLSLLITFPFSLSSLTPNNPIFSYVYLPILLAGLIVMCISNSGLFYVTYQASLNKDVTFPEGWIQGKSKIFQFAGLMITSSPLLFIGAFFIKIITVKSPSSPILWLFALLESTLFVSFFTFGFSAIMIDNIKVLAAAWTSFRIIIYGHNFYRVLAITGFTFLIRLLITGLVTVILATGLFGIILPTPLALDYPTYQKIITTPIVAGVNWIFNLILFPFETTMLILVYLKFTNDVSYPALAQRQNTA